MVGTRKLLMHFAEIKKVESFKSLQIVEIEQTQDGCSKGQTF